MSMHALVPVPVALPLLAAAVLAGAGRFLPRWAADVIAISACCAASLAAGALAYATRTEPILYWFGGFLPEDAVAIGIPFTVEPLGAGLSAVNALLAAAGLVFSIRYFDTYDAHFHVLVLAFVAALTGFSLTGDAFDMFVFFGLLSATGIALTGYKSHERGPIEGAVAFGVTQTIGAFLFLLGIALVYARAGSLAFAGLGRGLGAGADPLVVVALALMLSGLFVKAAVVPFHFWLADAHAVAPTPASVLFSGVMVPVALWGAAKLYGGVFAPALHDHEAGLRIVLLVAGALTATLGGFMCVLARHLKRLLAYSTVSHVGTMLLGLGLLDGRALGGAALYVVGHAFSKGALFFGAGMVLHSLGSVDETELHGRGKRIRVLSIVFFLGALGLAGFGPFGISLGQSVIEEAAARMGHGWVTAFAVLSAGLTSGAVLRVTLRVFFGWGSSEPIGPEIGGEQTEERETAPSPAPVPFVMWFPTAILLAGSIAVAMAPSAARVVLEAASNVLGTSEYAAWVLDGSAAPRSPSGDAPGRSLRHGVFALAIGALVATSTMYPARIGANAPQVVASVWRAVVHALRTIQSGRATEYTAWIVSGAAALAIALLCAL